MKEYTVLALFSVLLTILIDKISKIQLLKRIEFYVFLLIIFGFKLLVNGYLTASKIVIYNPNYFLGWRLGSIPFEDFLFGFSMVTLSVLFWEYFKKTKNGRDL